MTRRLFPVLFAAIITLMATSCLDNDKNDIQGTLIYDKVCNSVTDFNKGTSEIVKSGAYTFLIDYTNSKIRLGINELRLSDEAVPRNIVVDELPYIITADKSIKVDVTDVVSTPAGTQSLTYNFDRIYIEIKDRYISGNYAPIVKLSYNLQGDYEVTALPLTCTYTASLSSTNSASGSTYEKSDVKTTVNLNPDTKTASVEFNGVQFIGQMPALNMTFPGITFKGAAAGYTLDAASLIPTIAGDKYENYPISNFKANCSFNAEVFNLSFSCTPGGMPRFDVNMSLKPVDIP